MHQFVAASKLPVIYVLLRIGGKHKQQVDAHFANELGIAVHVAGPEHASHLQQLFSESLVVY